MDIEEMAERLRAAGDGEREQVLAELFAETVELQHDPVNEHDGPMPRERLTKGATAERDMLAQVMPDFTATFSYEVDGDRIIEQYHMGGTMPNGEVLDNPMVITFTVADGAITVMHAKFDPARTGLISQAFAQARSERAAQEA
jgi:ketosteroid isomerase-like protein